jgi:hypothetical protein
MGDVPRTRSVDNLQRLYTLVVGLALTESLRRLLATPPSIPLADAVAVIALVFTIVPFYHGANRYLDATYVTGERSARSGALMLDFIAIFIEGLLFFVLAVFVSNTSVFFTILAGLLLLDTVWVGLTKLTSTSEPEEGPSYTKWATANLIAAVAILVSVWSNLLNWEFWPTEVVRSVALVAIAIIRSAMDYLFVWKFYFPPPANSHQLIPAPWPARVPARTPANQIQNASQGHLE